MRRFVTGRSYGILERRGCGHIVSAFEVFSDNINFRTTLAGGFGGIRFHGMEVLFYLSEQFGKIHTLEGFDHEIAAGF